MGDQGVGAKRARTESGGSELRSNSASLLGARGRVGADHQCTPGP